MSTPASAAAAIAAAAGPRLGERLAATGALISVLASTIPGGAGDRASGVVASGGKRLRPLLALLMAGDDELPAEQERSLRTAAAAIELVHVATLVHDDVLDRAPVRRGIPTIWSEHGAPAAVGAGDALLAAAFEAVARGALPPVSRVLADAAGSLAAGELMQRADAYKLDITVQRYEARVIGKTAALFEAACRIGALHSGLDPDLAGGLGRDLGIAFQLLDDLLDIEGDPAVTGKPRGTDLLDGTVTLPVAFAARELPQITERALRAIDEPGAARLCDEIIASGATERVRGMATARIETAQSTIDRLPGGEGRRAALRLAAQGIVARQA